MFACSTYPAEGEWLESVRQEAVDNIHRPLQQLLAGETPEDVVVSLSLKTDSGNSTQANCFLCLQKDLKLQPVEPAFVVESATDGCLVTVKAEKFVRALCLSVDDAKCSFSDNYFDLFPGTPVQIYVKTDMSAEELKSKLKLCCLNQLK